MQDVPKIVLKRLQETAAAEAHPDADLLSAFVERSLAESERAHMMEHLSRCSDCRKVVEFALPATGAVVVAGSTRPTRSGWLSWPALRWSVVVAGIVAITSVGILQFRQRHQKNETLLSNLVPRNETTATAERPLSTSPAASQPRGAQPQTREGKQAGMRKNTLLSRGDTFASDRSDRALKPTFPASHAMHSAGLASGTGGGIAVGFGSGQAPNVALNSSARETLGVARDLKNATPGETAKLAPSQSVGQQVVVPSTSQTVEVVQSAAAAITPTQERNVSDRLSQSQKEQSLQQPPSTNLGESGAKNSAAARAGAPSDTSAAPLAPPKVAPRTAAAFIQSKYPRWNISSDGALQRSYDGGNTWVDVKVNTEPIASPSKANAATNTDEYEKSKDKVELQSGLVFRAVAAFGAEVWVGGSGAMLYHSTDSGTHWSRVVPSSSGAMLTGDITSIEFSDPQHGKIATSFGELWITADNGQTWSLH